MPSYYVVPSDWISRGRLWAQLIRMTLPPWRWPTTSSLHTVIWSSTDYLTSSSLSTLLDKNSTYSLVILYFWKMTSRHMWLLFVPLVACLSSICSRFLLCFLMLSFLPLPKYLSLHQHISNTSLPNSCLYIHYPCLLCFPLLPFLLDVAFALPSQFLSLQQYIYMTSVSNVIPIHPYSLPALLPDISFLSLSTFLCINISPTLLCRFHVFRSVSPVCFASRCCLSFLMLPLLSLLDSPLFNCISPWLLCRMSFKSIRSHFLLCFLILPLLPLPQYLSLHQRISNTSLPISCLQIRYPCLLCFPLLPFLLDVAFALSARFLSLQQYIYMTSVMNVIPIHPYSLPALLPDIFFPSSA